MWTNWFDDLCACRVFCYATDRRRSDCRLQSSNRVRVGRVRYTEHASSPSSSTASCVEIAFVRQHLKPSGVLLAEIALGREVTADEIAQNKRQALENELTNATGQVSYKDAVLKCLHEDKDPKPVDTAAFKDFYQGVILQWVHVLSQRYVLILDRLEKCCIELSKQHQV